MTLGERIRQNRKQNNMTQEYLAEHLSVTRQAVSKWENDTAVPTMENLLELSSLFGIPLNALAELPVNESRQTHRSERIWQILFAVSAAVLFLLLCFCTSLLKQNRALASPEEVSCDTLQNEILTEVLTDLPDGRSVRMQLVMTDGIYFTDKWEDYVPGGGIYDVNYQGTYQLWIVSNENYVLHTYDLTPDFDSNTLNFPGSFEIEIYDYNSDGLPDFTIGQHGSSSIHFYNLYTLEADGIRRICPEMIPDIGKRFSKIFPVDEWEAGIGFHSHDWSNANGESNAVHYRWDEKKGLFFRQDN